MSTRIPNIILKKNILGDHIMKTRKAEYGNVNIVGRRIETLRKAHGMSQKDLIARLQVIGCDINPTSYSKLEGQHRVATDKELLAIANVLEVSVNDLYE